MKVRSNIQSSPTSSVNDTHSWASAGICIDGRVPVSRWQTDHVGSTSDDAALIAELVDRLGHDRVHHSSVDRALHRRDASLIDVGESGPICFPRSTAEVVACVQVARRHDRPFVARGAGTGLAGGAVPLEGAVVIVTTRMDAVLSIDAENLVAWVEPGVVNLDLSRRLAPLRLHFAPDPSSQQACTIGGNVANNSGGPHCLALGVTSAHVLAVEVVLPDGEVAMLGGLDPDPVGYDLRGAFVGGEGTLGIATRIAVRLTPNPVEVRTMLLGFGQVDDAAATVSGIIGAGVVPAAIEMMDALITRAAEDFVHAGYPLDAAAILLVEVDGPPARVAADVEVVERVAREHRVGSVRLASDAAERELLWKGRKSAFGAVARVMPNYYLHDTVVPRRRLVEVMRQVYEIAARHDLLVMNVFHAGDGNLHPLLMFDGREPGVLERVHAAGAEIVAASLAAGGVLSGEHGIGLEKQSFMELQFSSDDLAAQARLRAAFDPYGRSNPGKVLPLGASCADVASLRRVPDGTWI
ncbi:MAG: FAD-binding protein [Acidimicrobiia bacterium]|nr:FAD-binding protein [Acidimicrobiia bacterium]